GFRQLRPAPLFLSQLLASGWSNRVIARAPVILRSAPLGSKPARLRHPVESGIKRAFLQTENIFGNLFDPQSDRIAMHAALRSKGLQYDHVECSLQTVVAMLAHFLPIASYRKA